MCPHLPEGCDQGAILFLPIDSAGPETPDILKRTCCASCVVRALIADRSKIAPWTHLLGKWPDRPSKFYFFPLIKPERKWNSCLQEER